MTAAGEPEANESLEIFQTKGLRDGIALDGSTRPDGTFTITERLRQGRSSKTLYFDAHAWKEEPCTSPSPFRGCDQRTSPATLSFTATIPKR